MTDGPRTSWVAAVQDVAGPPVGQPRDVGRQSGLDEETRRGEVPRVVEVDAGTGALPGGRPRGGPSEELAAVALDLLPPEHQKFLGWEAVARG